MSAGDPVSIDYINQPVKTYTWMAIASQDGTIELLLLECKARDPNLSRDMRDHALHMPKSLIPHNTTLTRRTAS
jgi:hypothetical protein